MGLSENTTSFPLYNSTASINTKRNKLTLKKGVRILGFRQMTGLAAAATCFMWPHDFNEDLLKTQGLPTKPKLPRPVQRPDTEQVYYHTNTDTNNKVNQTSPYPLRGPVSGN